MYSLIKRAKVFNENEIYYFVIHSIEIIFLIDVFLLGINFWIIFHVMKDNVKDIA